MSLYQVRSLKTLTKRLCECSYRLKTWYLFRYALGCGFANNRLYVVGGYPIQGDTAYSSEIYEFGSQQWRELTSKLLKPRINPGIYLYKGLITLFGTGELGIFSLDAEETKWSLLVITFQNLLSVGLQALSNAKMLYFTHSIGIIIIILHDC